MLACTHAQSQIISTQLHFQVRGSVPWLLPAQKSSNWLATETGKYQSRDIRTLKTANRVPKVWLQIFSVKQFKKIWKNPNGNHLAAPSVATHVQHQVIWRNMKEFTPGGKPFSYYQGGYKCIRLHVLRKHKRTHTVDKPFNCSQCDDKRLTLSDLRSHERTHTRDKPFSCPKV